MQDPPHNRFLGEEKKKVITHVLNQLLLPIQTSSCNNHDTLQLNLDSRILRKFKVRLQSRLPAGDHGRVETGVYWSIGAKKCQLEISYLLQSSNGNLRLRLNGAFQLRNNGTFLQTILA